MIFLEEKMTSFFFYEQMYFFFTIPAMSIYDWQCLNKFYLDSMSSLYHKLGIWVAQVYNDKAAIVVLSNAQKSNSSFLYYLNDCPPVLSNKSLTDFTAMLWKI